VCDHWFALAPTETFPNRAFACAATSQGHMNDGTASYTVGSIFGLLTRKNFPDTTPTGFPRSPETRPDPGALCVPGAAAPTRPGVVPGRLTTASPCSPRQDNPPRDMAVTRHQTRVHSRSLTFTHVHPARPSPHPWPPGGAGAPSVSPGLRTRTGQDPHHARQGRDRHQAQPGLRTRHQPNLLTQSLTACDLVATATRPRTRPAYGRRFPQAGMSATPHRGHRTA
jgi:hypothetical protein